MPDSKPPCDLRHKGLYWLRPDSPPALIVLCLLRMMTNKPLLHAILKSKLARAILTLSSTDRYLDIEIEGDIVDGEPKRSQYSVELCVADKVVAKSTHTKSHSSVLKWEWSAYNEM